MLVMHNVRKLQQLMDASVLSRELPFGESKWKRLTPHESERVLADLKERWSRCQLSARHPDVRFKVFDAAVLDPI